jgi:hypothetical protein
MTLSACARAVAVPALGVGATMFGAFGPASVGYNAFALTVDLGWFGDW